MNGTGTFVHHFIAAFFLICFAAQASCGPETTTIIAHPPGYVLNEPKVIKLPVLLNEISGLAYYPKDSSLFAIQDEEGFLYKIYPYHSDSILRWKFAGHGDFEDLMILDSSFYILRSDGDIFHTHISDTIATVKYDFPEKGNEFESIYYDAKAQKIRLVCKDCEADKKKTLSTFIFDPVTRQYGTDSLVFQAKEIARIQGEDKIKFKPSAAAVNPVSGKLFIISAVNKLLVVANPDGTIDNAYDLDDKLYKQPEGLAFAPDGTLFISNESANIGAATIFIIPYQPTKK